MPWHPASVKAAHRRRSQGRARDFPAQPSRRSARGRLAGSCPALLRDVVEIGSDYTVIPRILEKEGIVTVRRVDFRIDDVAAVADQRLDDLVRALRRKTPVGAEARE